MTRVFSLATGGTSSIQSALKSAGVAVVLVSSSFLASEYIMKYELPEINSAAADGKLRLFWVYVSHAGYDATELDAVPGGARCVATSIRARAS